MASLDTPISYHRLNKKPLDDREIFASLKDLIDYCDNGAPYNGQRVVVTIDSNSKFDKYIKYNIKSYYDDDKLIYIPIIDMEGSEPIFKRLTFKNDSSPSYGLLIYENNKAGRWDGSEIFSFKENKLCIISQLEIFRILDAAGNKTFKFYIERQERNTNNIYTHSWQQNYCPYDNNITITSSSGEISEMNYSSYPPYAHMKTNDPDIYIMPNYDGCNKEDNFITKIYVKADIYYKTLRPD